jgi:hypothetical protein
MKTVILEQVNYDIHMIKRGQSTFDNILNMLGKLDISEIDYVLIYIPCEELPNEYKSLKDGNKVLKIYGEYHN